MKKTLLLLVLFIAGLTANAQIYEPVKWKTSIKKLSDTEYQLIATATIEEGWHLYSQHLEEGGPLPTNFIFEESDDYELVGNMSEPKGHESYDDIFEMDVKYFDNKAVFTQKVNANSGTEIYCEVEFMACNDTTCTPPTYEDLEFYLE